MNKQLLSTALALQATASSAVLIQAPNSFGAFFYLLKLRLGARPPASRSTSAWRFIGILTIAVLLPTKAALGSPVDDYKQLVNQWLDVEAQYRHIRSDWHNQKPQLEQRITLLEQERDILRKKLDDNEKNQDSVGQRRAQQIERQETLERQQRQLSLWLHTQLSQIHEELDTLPPPLKDTWQQALKSVTEETSNSDKLATILGMFNKKHEFNTRISSIKTKILLADNSTKLVEQLYFGSALAYYATADGKQLGIGRPSPSGWHWQDSSELDFATFKQAQAMLEKQQSADLIPLPIILSQASGDNSASATEYDTPAPATGRAK